jgi:type IV pilus assembly protein PilQ
MKANRVLWGLVLNAGVSLALMMTPAAPAQAGPASQMVGLERTGPNTFSIDVEGADIRTVCRAISEFSGRNIVVASNVKGEVSIVLHNVSWNDALRTILRSLNLDYTDENGILRVDDASKLRSEELERETAHAKQIEILPLETRIIKLNYAQAAELTTPLQSALTRRGSIQVEKRTNSIIVSDLASNVEKVEKMAVELDSTTPQIEITAKLVDVDAEALRDLGIRWNLGGGTPDLTEEGDLPTDLQRPFNPNNDGDQQASGGVDEGIPNKAMRISYGLIKSWGSIEAQLQMLEQNRKANIISNPRITTVDNREAKILVGQKIPLIVQDVAGNPVSQLQTIGIQLKVTPHLTQDKKVVMDLHPEVSDLSTQSTVQGGVIINTSEADTRVMVDDGQTAVIGGLIRTNESSIRRGVPLLKDLPLLGFLFRSSNNVLQSRELIIFVTPRIVGPVASN